MVFNAFFSTIFQLYDSRGG